MSEQPIARVTLASDLAPGDIINGLLIEWDAERDIYRMTSILDDANPQFNIEVTGEDLASNLASMTERLEPSCIPLDWSATLDRPGPLCTGQELAGRMAENRSMDDGEQAPCPLCRERPAEVRAKGADSSVCYECLMDIPMELIPEDLARSMGHIPAEEAMDMGREPLPERPEVEDQRGPYTHYRPQSAEYQAALRPSPGVVSPSAEELRDDPQHSRLRWVDDYDLEHTTQGVRDANQALNEFTRVIQEWAEPIFIHVGDQHWA